MSSIDQLVQPIWEASHYPIAVVGYDDEPEKRKFVYINSAFTDLTGYTPKEAIGRPATLVYGSKTDRMLESKRETALKNGKAHESITLHYRKDGSEYAVRAMVAPLVEPDGRAEFLILTEVPISLSERFALFEDWSDGHKVVPLTLPMPLREYPLGQMPRHLDSRPDLDDLEALWHKICGGRVLPARDDFSLDVVLRWAPHLSVATVTPGERFQFRLFGTELARVYGRDLTGSFLDELTPADLWSVVIMHYREVVRTKQPLFAPVSVANGRWYNEVSRLLLPLSSGGDSVAFVMGADYVRTDY